MPGPWMRGSLAAHGAGVFQSRAGGSRGQDGFSPDERARIRLRNSIQFANRQLDNPCLEKIDALPARWEQEPAWRQDFAAPELAPLRIVETEASFMAMVAQLETLEVIALDLEQYQQRSFYGVLCTLQISTGSENFLVDTLASEVRQAARKHLHRVLSNPSIVKVMHAPKDDAKWLRRDFDVFLVNVFDTNT
eukprot:COSAG04_NODE_13417_length_607_cov_0.726378_1_plen_191_part_01